MTTLDSTKSSSAANSYVSTVDEANGYAATMKALAGLGVDTSGWDSVNDAIKTEALVLAARSIDTIEYAGEKVTEEQSMEFPRVFMKKIVDEDEIPDAVKMAQVAEACALLSASATDPVARAVSRGITSESAGGVSFTVGKGAKNSAADRGVSQPAFDILRKAGLIRPAATSVYNGRG